MSTSIPTFLKIYHPSLRNKVSKTTVTSFLLKKNSNPTPYRILEKKTTPSCTTRIHNPYEVAKSN
jgi:hypothetical protein